jgi:membrane protease YdiL (CAAX protease family)
MIAHINYTFNPFLLSADPTKLILNLCIGLFFGIVFENTKSLLVPILMHNYEDTISSIFGFVISFIHK